MNKEEQRPFRDYEQKQAIKLLQEVLAISKKARGDKEPEMQEMQIYYFLSDLICLPEDYKADWPTSYMR